MLGGFRLGFFVTFLPAYGSLKESNGRKTARIKLYPCT